MKIGDRFKDEITGKIYIIGMETEDDTLFLEGGNGLGRKPIGITFPSDQGKGLGDVQNRL